MLAWPRERAVIARRGGDPLDEEIDRMGGHRPAAGLGQAGGAKAGLAVHVVRLGEGAQQRRRAARGDRDVRPAEELQHGQGVMRRLAQADVARHRSDAAKFQAGVTAAESDRERIVDAWVAVEYYLPWRRAGRWRRAHAAMPASRRSASTRP